MRCDRSVPGKITFGTGNDWLELGGSGMVHRKVLENCGIDSTKYTGLRLRLRPGPHGDAEIRHPRHPQLL